VRHPYPLVSLYVKGWRKWCLALPRLQGICSGLNEDSDDALHARASVQQFFHWLEYDAAEPEENERELEEGGLG
jgi:hypothetical protein